MSLKKTIGVSALAAGVGVAGLLGVGLGTASADPGWGCDHPGARCDDHHDNHRDDHHDDGGPDRPMDWHNRGVDQGRMDHRPFNWHGQQVNPMPAGNGHGWGFWFGGTWIPL